MFAVPVVAPVLVGGEEVVRHVASVVVVRALGMYDLAEDALPREVEREHLDLAVDAVLELHAVDLALLCGLDHLPTILHRERGRHLGKDVLAAVHRGKCHGNVQVPRRGVVDHVHVARITQRTERLRTLVHLRFRTFLAGEGLLRLVDLVVLDVTHRRHHHAGELAHAVDHAHAARTDTDHAHAHAFQRLAPEAQHWRSTDRRRSGRVRLKAARHGACGPGEHGVSQEVSSALH